MVEYLRLILVMKIENRIILNQDFELDEELSENVLINLNTAFINNCIKITVNNGYKFSKTIDFIQLFNIRSRLSWFKYEIRY